MTFPHLLTEVICCEKMIFLSHCTKYNNNTEVYNTETTRVRILIISDNLPVEILSAIVWATLKECLGF